MMMEQHLIAYYLGILLLVVFALRPYVMGKPLNVKDIGLSLLPIALIAYYFLWKEGYTQM